MIIYKCKNTGDELFSDAKKIEEVNGFYKIAGKNMTVSTGIDESAIGGNASQEEQAEGTDDAAISGIDVVLAGRYNTTVFGKKKEYLAYMKDYLKTLMKNLEIAPDSEEEKAFKNDIKVPFTAAQEMFKDLDFYTTESQQDEGMIILCRWEVPEGKTDDVPYFYYYKVGVKAEKV